MEYDFTYLSFGAGVQSTALLAMSMHGWYDCPKADVAIFADTGDEPSWVYEHLDYIKRSSGSIPIEVVSIGTLSKHMLDFKHGKRKRIAGIPAFILDAEGKSAPAMRQCTDEYKIKPIQGRVKQLLGYSTKQRVRRNVRAMIGISMDEVHRMKPSKKKWITNYYPLIESRLRWNNCVEIIQKAGWLVPKKSSCLFCPYHSNRYWRDMKATSPAEFTRAVEVDGMIRDMQPGLNSQQYLHRRRVPLDQIKFDDGQQELFGEECEGYCGV